MNSDILLYCRCSIIGIFTLIYFPCLIYYGVRYYKHRNHPALRQRYASITIIELILSCILLIVNSFELTSIQNKYHTELYIVWAICASSIFSCWVWRYWMISFHTKWHILMENQQWISVIDPQQIQQSKSNWIVSTKHRLGNFWWMGYHIIFPWNIMCYIYIIITFIYYTNIMTQIILLTFTVWIPLIILFTVYCNLPSFDDHFFISQELRLLIIVFMFFAINDGLWTYIYFSTNLTESIDWREENNIISIIFVFINFGEGTALTMDMLIATGWVLRKVKDIIIVSNRKRKSTFFARNQMVLLHENINDTLDIDSIQKSQLKQIFNDKSAFEIYINHLSKEYCMEFLIALIEITQLQKWITAQDIDFDHNKFAHSLFVELKFFDGIPESVIVFNENDDDHHILQHIKEKANELYWKYIEYGSKHEIIVRNETRSNISDIMSHLDWIQDDEINVNHILELFDQCCNDIFLILIDGFGRFQATKQWLDLNLMRPVYA